MEVSGRETSLAVFGMDFGGDSLSAMAVIFQSKAIHRSQHDQLCCPSHTSNTSVRLKDGLLMNVFTFRYEKK